MNRNREVRSSSELPRRSRSPFDPRSLVIAVAVVVAGGVGLLPATASADLVTGRFTGGDARPVRSVVAAGDYTCVLLAVASNPVRCWGSISDPQQPAGLDARQDWANLSTRSKAFCLSAGSWDRIAAYGGGEDSSSPERQPTCWTTSGPYASNVFNELSIWGPVSLASSFGCGILQGGEQVGCWGSGSGFPDGNPGGSDQQYGLSDWGGATEGLALGTRHGCAVESGRVHCWGSNSVGQVAVPTPLTDGHRLVESVSSGATHSCAVLKHDGSVACWGDNRRGAASPPDGLRRVRLVAAGGQDDGSSSWTCAVTRNSTVICWGDNQFGQSSPPADLGRVRELSAGAAHTCAITISFAVRCWGSNSSGQAAVPTNLTPAAPAVVSAPVIAGEAAVGRSLSLSLGEWDSAADLSLVDIVWQASADGSVWSDLAAGWTGTDVTKGQVGQVLRACVTVADAFSSRSTSCSSPTPKVTAFAVNDFFAAHVAAGRAHSCAVSRTGRVVCWGSDGSASAPPSLSGLSSIASGGDNTCGVGPGGKAVCWTMPPPDCEGCDSSSPVQLDLGFGSVKSIAVGPYHICAITKTEIAECRLIDGDRVIEPTGSDSWGSGRSQGQADVPADLGPVKAVSAGAYHTCALKLDATVTCWGRNVEGQTEVPSDLANVKSLAAGGFHNCAVGSDDRPVCWGYNYDGQASVPDGLGTVRQISLGLYHSCAVLTDRTVSCWGTDDQGQTEIGPLPNGVAEVAAGAGHTCVMTVRGQVSCWGNNRRGQTEVPLPLEQVVDVAVAAGRTCVVTIEKVVRCFGSAGSASPLPAADGKAISVRVAGTGRGVCAQMSDRTLTCDSWLGQSVDESENPPVVRSYSVGNRDVCWIALDRTMSCDPGKPFDTRGAVSVTAGPWNMCWIRGGGSLSCAGDNSLGQSSVPSGLGSVSAVALGDGHTCALTAATTVRCWGFNEAGQIDVPAGLTGVTAVAAGRRHSCALTATGVLRCWGADDFGQASVPSDLGTVSKVAAGGDRTCVVTAAASMRCWGEDMKDESHDPGVAGIAPLPSVVSLVTEQASPTNTKSISFRITFSEAVEGLTGADFAPTGTSSGWSVQSVTGSGSGPYTVTLSGPSATSGSVGVSLLANSITDQYGSAAPVSRTDSVWQIAVDVVPPSAPGLAGPAVSPVNSPSTSMVFAGEVGATFACSLDGVEFSRCSSPLAITGLTSGAHEFRVRQTDAAGNVGPVASSRWVVDLDPPAAPQVTDSPAAQSNVARPTFAFTGEPLARFECSLDSQPLASCTSPLQTAALSSQAHTFRVRQIDQAGNVGPITTVSWTVDLVPPIAPSVTGGWKPAINLTTLTAQIAGEAGTTSLCSLDGSLPSACTSPFVIVAEAEGAHNFAVRQVDAAGNIGPAFTASWVTDLTTPAFSSVKVVAVKKAFQLVSTLTAAGREATWLEFSTAAAVLNTAPVVAANRRAYAKTVAVPVAGIRWARVGDAAGNQSAWVRVPMVLARSTVGVRSVKSRSRRHGKSGHARPHAKPKAKRGKRVRR